MTACVTTSCIATYRQSPASRRSTRQHTADTASSSSTHWSTLVSQSGHSVVSMQSGHSLVSWCIANTRRLATTSHQSVSWRHEHGLDTVTSRWTS